MKRIIAIISASILLLLSCTSCSVITDIAKEAIENEFDIDIGDINIGDFDLDDLGDIKEMLDNESFEKLKQNFSFDEIKELFEAFTSDDIEAMLEENTVEEIEEKLDEEIEVDPSLYETEDVPEDEVIDKDGTYTTKDDVGLYISTYKELPENFITKDEAEALGWKGGSVEKYAEGKSIGGDYFGNYNGALPKKKGRTYHECDIDTQGEKSRGAKRIVYSNDGLVYYTDDHYETFELLYGEEILEEEAHYTDK